MIKSQGIVAYFILILLIVTLGTAGISCYKTSIDLEKTKREHIEQQKDRTEREQYRREVRLDAKLARLSGRLDVLQLELIKTETVNIKTFAETLDYVNKKTNKMSYEEIKKHVVHIYGSTTPIISSNDVTEIVPSESWIGTGFVVRKSDRVTYIVTNAHVAGQDKYKPIIKVGDNYLDSYKAIYIEYHEKYDLALLIVIGSIQGKEAIKGIRDANYEQRLQVVGHHLGRKYLYGEGVYAGKQTNRDLGLEFDVYQLPILYGNSGSPVFNQDGYVVGVIFAINGYNNLGGMDTAHGVAIPGKVLKEFIKEVL